MLENLNRQQLGHRVNSYPYSVYSKCFNELIKKGSSVGRVGYNSDVYFVRAALEKKFDVVYPLPYVESLMLEMGWKDKVNNRRQKTKKEQ